MEDVLRSKMADLPNVATYFGWTAKTIAQDDDEARVTVVDESGAGHQILTADYVVGCDGGHSMVRDQVGIGAEARTSIN